MSLNDREVTPNHLRNCESKSFPSGLSSEMLANKLNLLTVCINTVSYGLWQVKVEQETYSASSATGEGLVVR